MARWTVQDEDQVLVIEATAQRVSIDIPSPPFVTDADGVRDLRRKLGLAINEADPGSLSTP